MAFTSMDAGTFEEWTEFYEAHQEWQSALADRMKTMLARLAKQSDGMAIDELQHSLQTASRAMRSGASEELIAAALCHDIGTAISYENHGAIAAEILRPYVSGAVYEIVRTHQAFQSSHYHEKFGRNAMARQRYSKERWFRTAERFSDEWDQASFDPAYETLPLEYFAPLLGSIFAEPRGQRGASESRNQSGLPRWLGQEKGTRTFFALRSFLRLRIR